ncbi:tetratricopeptide repeat protein [Corallibacter sp.]|uniref:tetratricopeptide repeat protein n=1 Tax=Corallibacter sp. TaxID=2038084 RepID=UPI003AB36636
MNKQDLLYRYFSKSLTPNEEHVFENLLNTDAEFKKQFEFEKNLKQVIQKEESKKLKAKLQDFEKDIITKTSSEKTTQNIFNYKNFAIAATIALLMGWFGYNTFFNTSYNDLYQDNFKVYPNTVYTITRSDDNNTIERQAFVAYETEDYQLAINKFNAIPETEKNSYLTFYKAQAFLKLENLKDAKLLFEEVIVKDRDFVAESHWYLALIYLKENDKENTRKQLKLLISNFDYNKSKAKDLLDKIN